MALTKTSYKKGEASGRPKGSMNKSSKDIKQAFQLLIENNIGNLNVWLNNVASKDPAKALNIIINLSEYVIPKQARQDIDLNANIEKIEHPQIKLIFNRKELDLK